MARSVPEWIGKTDDTPPSAACKRRILERQGYKCALTGLPFDEKNKPEFDHIVELWLDGENQESNLQAVRAEPHARKTAAAAAVRAKTNRILDQRFDTRTAPTPKINSAGFVPSEKSRARQAREPKPSPPHPGLYRAAPSSQEKQTS